MKIAKIDSIVIKVPFSFGAAKDGPAPTTGEKNTILLVKVETALASSAGATLSAMAAPRR